MPTRETINTKMVFEKDRCTITYADGTQKIIESEGIGERARINMERIGQRKAEMNEAMRKRFEAMDVSFKNKQ